MKAQELRIGNWYKGDMIGGGEYQITPEDIQHLHDDPQDDYYQPIPLTEEWLLEFGCERHHVYDGLFEYILKVNKTQIKFYADSDGILADVLGGIDIKTVHTFQNLVFALTGEELIISQ